MSSFWSSNFNSLPKSLLRATQLPLKVYEGGQIGHGAADLDWEHNKHAYANNHSNDKAAMMMIIVHMIYYFITEIMATCRLLFGRIFMI